MTFAQVTRILLARKAVVIAVFVGVMLLVVAAYLVTPKMYFAETSILVDTKGTDPVTGAALTGPVVSRLKTEVDVVSSRTVALKVIDKLNVPLAAESATAFAEAGATAQSARDRLAERLLTRLEVTPSKESNVVRIGYSHTNPRLAAEFANAFADAYMQRTLELKSDPAQRQALWFQSQVKVLRKNLETALERQSEYQRINGIAGTDDRVNVENTRLAEISSQLVNAQTLLLDSEAKLRQAGQAVDRQQLEQLPDILGNVLLQNIKADLVRAQAKLGEVSQRYDTNHPQYRSAVAEVEQLQSKLNAEYGTVMGSVRQTAEIARQRAAASQRSLDEQNSRVLALKQQRDDLAVLTREVENAQRTYDAAIQRADATSLQGQFNESSMAVLTPAAIPGSPARPRLLLNLLVGLVLGGFLSVGIALGSEVLNRRLRSVHDFDDSIGLLVLGEIPRFRISAPRAVLQGA